MAPLVECEIFAQEIPANGQATRLLYAQKDSKMTKIELKNACGKKSHLAIRGFMLVVLAVIPAVSADAHHAAAYQQIGFGPSPDNVYNYVSCSAYTMACRTSPSNVDMPIRFLFAGEANVNKVKYHLDGNCPARSPIGFAGFPALCASGGAKCHWRIDRFITATYYIDQDEGINAAWSCELDRHMRIYAYAGLDYNQESGYGKYVVAAVHKDHEPLFPDPPWACAKRYYSAEGEEGWWISRIQAWYPAWTVASGASNWLNFEAAHWSGSHWIQSDGMTTYVTVP